MPKGGDCVNKKSGWRITKLLLCICMMVLMFPVYSAAAPEQNTKLTIQHLNPDVDFTFYKVADFSEHGKYELLGEFAEKKAMIKNLETVETSPQDMTVELWAELADTLDVFVLHEKVSYDFIERTDEKTVKATAFNEGGNIIAKAKAKCSPEDKWDFYVGANLAVERLEAIVEEKKTKATSLNTEMVCIKNTSFFEDCFTVGKIYKVTNGTLECNHNNIPVIFQNVTDNNCRTFNSVKEINAISSAIQFLEIVK